MKKSINEYFAQQNISIRAAMEILNTAKRVVFVVEGDYLVGSLTDGDIRRWILGGGSLDANICEAMNQNPHFALEGDYEGACKLIDELELLAIPIVTAQMKILDVFFWNEKRKPIKKDKISAPVVIMAGGKGERLMPYTSIVPKPLIPIGEKAISELVIESFQQYGCEEFYFTLNYKKNMIKAYFDELEKKYTVHYIEEQEPLGTGGSLCFVRKDMKTTFFVSNCDILLEVDYADIFKFHKKSCNIITMVTSLKKYTVPYGVVKLDELGKIQELEEKPTTDYLINTGVYVIEPEALGYLKDKEFIHIPDLINRCMQAGKSIGAYPISEGAWMDMGQFEQMELMKQRIGY